MKTWLWIAVVAMQLGSALCASSDSPVGVWRGESLCTSGAASCHDEIVVYYVEAADNPDTVMIRADKIVDGKAITMGSGPWKYDRAKQTLTMGPENRLWVLVIKGKRIEGTLTVTGNVVFRKMTLTKSN